MRPIDRESFANRQPERQQQKCTRQFLPVRHSDPLKSEQLPTTGVPPSLPCDTASDFLDREIFQQTLGPGCRSPLYRTNPEVNREYPEGQHIFFYCLNTGQEIARVVPQWAAEDPELLSLGQGYPVVISEAHEQAVINGQDRRLFQQMVIETLERRGLATYTSENERSKSRPWL